MLHANQRTVMFVYIPVPLELFLVYAAAARLLRRALGAEAPAVTDLLSQEFTHRRAKSIAEEYLELHGRPTLRTCRRALAKNRQTIRKGRTRNRSHPDLLRSLPSALVRHGDPTRN